MDTEVCETFLATSNIASLLQEMFNMNGFDLIISREILKFTEWRISCHSGPFGLVTLCRFVH